MTSLHGVYVTSSHHKFTPFLNVHSMIHILKVSKQHHILKQIWRVFFLHIIFFKNQETLLPNPLKHYGPFYVSKSWNKNAGNTISDTMHLCTPFTCKCVPAFWE